MENFLKVLDKYGLELGFEDEKNEKKIQKSFNYLSKRETHKNVYVGLFLRLVFFKIRIKDFQLLSQKLEIPEHYRDISLLVEKNVLFELNFAGGDNSFVMIKSPIAMVDYVEQKLRKKPEMFGIKKEKIEIMISFSEEEALKSEARKLLDKMRAFCADKEIKGNLRQVGEEISSVLKDSPDHPDWYMKYFQKNEIFKRIAESQKGEFPLRKNLTQQSKKVGSKWKIC